MYDQSLFKILDDHIKPNIIKKNNRYKKWEYGYNKEHDVIVISKTGNTKFKNSFTIRRKCF